MYLHITPRRLRLIASLHKAVAARNSTLEDAGADILGTLCGAAAKITGEAGNPEGGGHKGQ